MYYIEEVNNTNPLLNSVLIKNDKLNFHSSIYPNLGATLQQLSTNGIEIIDGITNNENGLKTYKNKYNSSFLFPFPSRIPAGKYSFQNNIFELECNEQTLNNALHGHIYNKKFFIFKKETTKNLASITFTYSDSGNTKGFPFPYQIEITYVFTSKKLTVNFQILNIGNSSFPFGLGWHPYFKTEDLNNSILDFNSDFQISFNKKMMPEGEIPLKYNFPFKIASQQLDDGFILKKSKATINTKEYNAQLQFSSKTPNSFLQVYTPPNRESIAVEPMTCAPNCFNNKNGLLTLNPNESYDWQINLKYS